MSAKVVLITGAARRIGAGIARSLHGAGFRVVLHHHRSTEAAAALAAELNAARPDSARCIRGDLLDTDRLADLVDTAAAQWGGLDGLVNNASRFYPSPIGSVTRAQWDELLGTNLTSPFFLSQAAAPHLRRRRGAIVNLADIHADRGLENHAVYCAAKAGLVGLTRSLAKDLAPEIRVNAVAPGAILWPEQGDDPDRQREILARIPLSRPGTVDDIAGAVLFLLEQAPYVTGQILSVDGGRSLTI